jgi:hypothetical protein
MATSARPPTAEKAHRWPVRKSPGGRIGLAVAVLLLVAGAGLLWFSLQLLTGTPRLVGLAAASVAIGLGAAFLAATIGFYRLSYEFEPDRLLVRGGNRVESILLDEIEGIYAGQRVGSLRTVYGFTWPGYYVGIVRGRGLGTLRVYCTDRRVEALSVIVTADRAVVLTPDDPGAFRRELIRRIESVPGGAATGRSATGAVVGWLPQPAVMGLFGAALALLVATALAVQHGYPALPELIALQAEPAGRAGVLSPREEIFNLPLLGAVTLLCNLLIALALRGRSLPAATLLASSSTLIESIVVLSAMRILPQ